MTDKFHLRAPLEEVLRAFFLRTGFFVIRGAPFRFADEDLTDVDLWLYERPTGTTRRIQICDIKDKQRPRAVERLFWTRGLADALDIDGAYVATTDKRKSLHEVAQKLDIRLIDGTDIQRIQANSNILYPDRITDEQLIQQLQSIDKGFRNRDLQDARIDILSSLSEGFGAPSVVRALENFGRLAQAVTVYHPDSAAARAAGRLAYLAASIVCESLDYVSVEAAFRPLEERRELLLNAVRLGALSKSQGQQSLKIAFGFVEKYAPGGKAAAVAMEAALKKDLSHIPAEIVADQAIRLLKTDQLFLVGRDLEQASYSSSLPIFDQLNVLARAMLGALLDYACVDRKRFAEAWRATESAAAPLPETDDLESSQSTLFGDPK